MSELTIEQKAKLYDEVVERGNSLLSCNELGNAWVYKLLPELEEPEDERIRKWIIDDIKYNMDNELLNGSEYKKKAGKAIAWLEKQGQSKKTSIWKHWKNGIAGNGEGKSIFLIKRGSKYSLSSCLDFECDYIELSELDNLMLEKQDNLIDANKEYWRGYREGKQEALDKYSELEKQSVQNINIFWHDVSEEPEEHREIFCEWKGYADNVWYDVAFYHPSNKTFWNGEQQIENVVRWTYVDEILEKQFQSYIKPTKFKAGDTIQCISDETDKRTIAEIDTLYNVYRCENNYPIPFTQENMWKLI